MSFLPLNQAIRRIALAEKRLTYYDFKTVFPPRLAEHLFNRMLSKGILYLWDTLDSVAAAKFTTLLSDDAESWGRVEEEAQVYKKVAAYHSSPLKESIKGSLRMEPDGSVHWRPDPNGTVWVHHQLTKMPDIDATHITASDIPRFKPDPKIHADLALTDAYQVVLQKKAGKDPTEEEQQTIKKFLSRKYQSVLNQFELALAREISELFPQIAEEVAQFYKNKDHY